jgi:oxygen-independent coproporphyrinogen-3 oxidase
MSTEPLFDPGLLTQYDIAGPRYTSYPTAPHFQSNFGASDYRQHALTTNEDPVPKPLSIYVHVPFCQSPCFYCGCNREVTRDINKADVYLTYLTREIKAQSKLFDRDRRVLQLHLGGGTPNFLSTEQLTELIDTLRIEFNFEHQDLREFSIELDPRWISPEQVRTLALLGFNRASLGVQDFDPAVQEAINRVQSIAETQAIIAAARASGFRSINLDLIYGLPKQTLASFRSTLERVCHIKPDRIALYSYAHLPNIFRAQRHILTEDLPSPAIKLSLLGAAVEILGKAGYHYIGMDHFALSNDDLTIAQKNHTLQRNFQGYSTHAECDLIGLGVSAIGHIGDSYAQNFRDLKSYYDAIDSGHLPIAKGVVLTTEDTLRAQVIQALLCHGEVDFITLEQRYPGLSFEDHFAYELGRINRLAQDGLVDVSTTHIRVTPRGRLLMRVIAMAFDTYLPPTQQVSKFSKVI